MTSPRTHAERDYQNETATFAGAVFLAFLAFLLYPPVLFGAVGAILVGAVPPGHDQRSRDARRWLGWRLVAVGLVFAAWIAVAVLIGDFGVDTKRFLREWDQPGIMFGADALLHYPSAWVFPLLAIVGIGGGLALAWRNRETRATG